MSAGRRAGRVDLGIVGGGPIGLSIAWRCAQRGLDVAVYDDAIPPDDDPAGRRSAGAGRDASGAGVRPALGEAGGAWEVAAGMLAPIGEAYFGEAELTALLVDSAARWPGFAAELEAAAGAEVGYRAEGTLAVALTADDLATATRLVTYQRELGLAVEPLTPSAMRAREPVLSPRVRGGALIPDDHQVDPRRMTAALRVAASRAGVRFVRRRVADVCEVYADRVVVAAGCGAAALTGLPVRPVRGEVLRLRAPGEPGFTHVIRGYADGHEVYLVPRRTGEVVVGATAHERADGAVTAGAVLHLLRAAAELVPEIEEYALVEAQSGARPGSPDNRPILGRWTAASREVVVATGHYRHGILLTPVTADLITALLLDGTAPPAAFAAERFSERRAPACA
ncbi:glycine oxidase ThiO [Catenuloplanes atrovinosus]|uniref:glycine oxidase n=1 Tax=Catenuloplanes atrovinosus TaxID=137266 RepID=A0AAE3YVK3_9ACTN|nr:glycine oxidase ThiO [Catenuloplanes atrovinosus]MDR7279436.1 glycine oxidase [Catenuloplanes atrovinosus]